MDHSTIALIVSIVVLAISIGKDLIGGSSKLASKFSSLKEETTAAVTALRIEFIEKSETNNSNSRVGFEAITANIHALQLGSLEFRAQMAENYMRRDSFYKATDDLKRDFNEKHNELKLDVKKGFEEIRDQLDAMAQSIEAGRKQTRHV